MSILNELSPGDKMYYPSDTGIALLCQVLDTSKEDILVRIGEKKFFLPKESVEDHAIKLNKSQGMTYVAQRIEDPDNSIVYLRYRYRETLLDRLYNWYCRKLKRGDQTIIPPEYEVEALPSARQE